MKSSSKAFTIIELIFVVVVLGILWAAFMGREVSQAQSVQPSESVERSNQDTTSWN